MSSWMDGAAQMMASKIDEEILNDLFENEIRPKLRFSLRLKGLEFGGVLEKWGVATEQYSWGPAHTGVGHHMPIVPKESKIYYHKRRFSNNSPYDPLHFTDIVSEHYPEDYVVTTHDHYYYLGEREFTHDHFEVTLDRHNKFEGTIRASLIDCGESGNGERAVLHTEVYDPYLYNDATIDHLRMLKGDLLNQYKDMIRRGC